MTSAPPAAPDSAERLVEQALRGDEAAFARIVRLHHADMVRACFVMTGDRELARDGVRAAWSVAWERLASLRQPDRLRPWLCWIAVAETRRLIHRRARRRGDAGAAGTDLPKALVGRTLDDRALLTLRYVAELDARELAVAAEGFPTGRVAALRRLASRLRATPAAPELTRMTLSPVGVSALRAYSAIEVWPVEADRIAREAHDELEAARSHAISVLVGGMAGALTLAAYYVYALGQHV